MIATHTHVEDVLTPVSAYAALRQADPQGASFLFESVVGGERWGRYSILGYRPRYELLLGHDGWKVRGHGVPPELEDALRSSKDPLAAAAPLFAPVDARVKGNPASRFARAHVGYFTWDLIHHIEKVPGWAEGEAPVLARFLGGATILVFDNLGQTLTIAAEDQADVDRALADLQKTPRLRPIALPDRLRMPADVTVNVDDEAYEKTVLRAKEYIKAGDTFQVQIGRTFSVPRHGRDPFDVYRALRGINPSPYMYYLDLPAAPGETSRTQVAGASPEILVRLEDDTMTIRPIAGTRPRGATEAEDQALAEELLADPKERAEHVMLIDLGRNDVGRVAEVGSVEVRATMVVERYSHVMHIVSEVVGKVPPSLSPLEVVRAAFPAGTLSGAPKVRSMQIIRELEARPRGIYGGGVGYIARTGDLDFAIAIRTAVCKGDTFEVTAAAGVVEASIPKNEADETRNKARGVLCAIEAAPRG